MRAEPVRELETLRGDAAVVKRAELAADAPIAVKAPGDLLDVLVEADAGRARELRLRFGSNEVVYDVAGQTLDGMPLPLEGGRLRVRVVVDRPLYEVVGGGGAVYETARRGDAGKSIESVWLSAVGGPAGAASVTVYPMRSIWAK